LKYLSVLTPPALVCAAFLIALVAFLRHEMGGRRASSEDLPPESISGEDEIHQDHPDTSSHASGASDRLDNK
jgi:hypothetical protein